MRKPLFVVWLGILLLPAPLLPAQPTAPWQALLDANLSQWDKFIGVPHHTVPLEGVEKGDGMNGTPLGLNRDPLNVFSVEMRDGEPVLHVSGQIYGGLSTKAEFENYHLSVEFKWGERKWEPRLNAKHDSGILYHGQEPHGQFWNVWLRAPEMQIQEGDCGDFHALAGVAMDVRASRLARSGPEMWLYDPAGELRTFQSGGGRRVRRSVDHEKPNDQWNHVELICLGDKAYHIVNDHVVMVLENSVELGPDDTRVPLTRGKIQLQSEGAEVYYRNIRIRSLAALPAAIAAQVP